MGMTIDELITFSEEEEQNHRVKAKRADDASGYTRSKDKNIRTASAIREEVYGDFYKQIAETMRKYQQLQADYENRLKADKMATFKEFRDKLSKWMFHNSESVCGDNMIVIDYLEGHMDELLYELGIYEVEDGNDTK